MKQNQLIHFPISIGSYSSFVDRIISLASSHSSSYVCIANVHMFIEAYRDSEFIQIIKNADIVTPDGMPLTWGLSWVHGIKQDRVSGMDLLPDLLPKMINKNLSAYFYGGSLFLLNKTEIFLKSKFPFLKLAGFYSPPFRDLTQDEDAEIIDRINRSNADVVFVMLGCPKQEKWMGAMQGKISACMIGVGGALPVMVGLQKRAPMWMQERGMEWFFRLCQEPRRMFKRYAVTNTFFFYLIIKDLLKSGYSKKSR